MCRWIAYQGETTPLERYVTEPARSLIIQSLHALEGVSTNGDGFGLGWYNQRLEPGVYREVRPAWSDENLHHLCHHIHSHLFFAHVRASTGTAVTRANCHPFVCDNWLFMHNGFIGNWERLRRPVEGLIPDALYPTRFGTTDSESLFLAIMGAGGNSDPLEATASTMAKLTELVCANGKEDKLRFTAALTNGEDLYAFRYAVNDRANTLYYREQRGGTVIVSEPLDLDRTSWISVPENSVVIARRGKPTAVMPFM